MNEKIYPDLQKICRLCLRENEGTVCIFPKEESSADKYSDLSIPMRIMTCASIEVQRSDDFPKKICTDCRLQLEKSYYFRRMSQVSDRKLKRHLRLVSNGKVSTVFAKKLEDDDYGYEECKDSLEFIQEQEAKKKQEEEQHFEKTVNDVRLQFEQEMERQKTKYQEELVPLIRDELKKDLRIDIQREVEENLRQAIMDQCLIEAKKQIRDEVREECRQLEIKSLLDDLQKYLTTKKQTLEESPNENSNINIIKSSKTQTKTAEINSNVEYVEMEIQSQCEERGNTSNQIIPVEEINLNDEECDSETNFVAYDTDEGFEIRKKGSDNIEAYDAKKHGNDMEYEDEEVDNNTSYTKIAASEIIDNIEESQDATTTSYRIDNESGEIQFLKKTESNNSDIDENNLDQTTYENIMIIKLPDNMDGEYMEEEFEEVKFTEPKKQLLAKCRKSSEKKPIVSSSVSKTKTTVEATVLTKTYVNPMQRSTDTPKIFKCNDCPMVFSTKQSLERHIRTHKKIEKLGVTFQCPECRVVVSCSSALRRHMYIHCEEKPFSCNLCDKSFVQKEILKRHMQTHTGVRPHRCPHCERAFAQRINLTQHINRHHLEEPRVQQHPCHLCPKRFNHASGLSRHLATHSGVAFQCSECDRTFGDRSSIKRHIASMHTNTKAAKTQNK